MGAHGIQYTVYSISESSPTSPLDLAGLQHQLAWVAVGSSLACGPESQKQLESCHLCKVDINLIFEFFWMGY